MARGEPAHASPGPTVGRWLVLAVVVALVATAGVAYRDGVLDDWTRRLSNAQQPVGPAAVPPPEGLELPPLAQPSPVAAAIGEQAAPPVAAKVRRALAPYLSDRDLGRHVLAAVATLDGDPVWQLGTGVATPASTTKVLTAVAALEALGPEHRFTTSVVSAGRNRIVLVGGGDPLLASRPSDPEDAPYPERADVATLAARTARALKERGVRRVRVGFDDSLFTGPTASPAWRPDYIVDGIVAPITALWVDEGRDPSGSGRVANPALEAARTFAAWLAARGIRVVGDPVRGVVAGGDQLASVESAPVRAIIERALEVSDNEASEVLAHHVGLASKGEGSFAGGAAATAEILAELGVPTNGLVLHDGSGLSRGNRIAPTTLVGALAAALDPGRPEMHVVGAALPVAGFTGSLTNRFDEAARAALGRVRAKTGTLTGVTALAGIATALDGTPMLFVLMADRVRKPKSEDARQAMDNAAGALGACRCAAG